MILCLTVSCFVLCSVFYISLKSGLNPEGKRLFGSHSLQWKDNSEIYFEEVVLEEWAAFVWLCRVSSIGLY